MKRTMTVPVDRAYEIAKQVDDDALIAAVERVIEAGWDVLVLEAEQSSEGFDISIREPSGVMVALMLPGYQASMSVIEGGESAEDLHITLAYLGEASAMSLDDQRKLIGVVGEVVQRHTQLNGQLAGTGRFVNGEETDPFWIGVDVPGIDALQADLVESLANADLPVVGNAAGQTYTPHVTVAYIPAEADDPAMEFKPMDVYFTEVTVAIGANRFGLIMPITYEEYGYEREGWIPEAVNKSVETVDEDRFTLGPWYVPDFLDAHGEWTDVAEVQKALWGYVEKGNRDIRLQHNTDIVAGRWVEAVTWPQAFTTELTKASGEKTEHTFPAGTPFLGVIWEPWAWEFVKQGKITGYSIGGKSSFMEVDLEGADPSADD